MRSGQQRRQRGIGSGEPADQVPGQIGAHRESGLLEPAGEGLAGREIGVAPCGSEGALRRRADPGDGFHPACEAFAVDAVLKGAKGAGEAGDGSEGRSGGSRTGQEFTARGMGHPGNCAGFGPGARGSRRGVR